MSTESQTTPGLDTPADPFGYEAGWVWTAPDKPRLIPREIIDVQRRKHFTRILVKGMGETSKAEFRDWAKRNGAKPSYKAEV